MVKALVSGVSAASALVVAAGLLCRAVGALAAPAPKSLEDLQATRQRPLFSPTRRPPPVVPAPEVHVAVPQAPPPAPPPDLEVSGVIVGPDARSVIVHHAQDTTPTYLSVGSQIDGWTVSAIRSREVVLQHDTRSVTIGLPDPSHRVATPGVPGQAGPGGATNRMKPLRPEPEL